MNGAVPCPACGTLCDAMHAGELTRQELATAFRCHTCGAPPGTWCRHADPNAAGVIMRGCTVCGGHGRMTRARAASYYLEREQ